MKHISVPWPSYCICLFPLLNVWSLVSLYSFTVNFCFVCSVLIFILSVLCAAVDQYGLNFFPITHFTLRNYKTGNRHNSTVFIQSTHLFWEFSHQYEVSVKLGGGGPGVGWKYKRDRQLFRESLIFLFSFPKPLGAGEGQQVRWPDHLQPMEV